MEIYIKGEDGFLMTLPVNPEEIVVNESQQFDVVDILNAGEIPLVGFADLQTFTIESFLPSVRDGNYIKGGMNALDYFNRLRKWKVNRQPVRVVISGLFGQALKGGNVNQLYYITDFQFSSKYGYETDIPYKLKLLQYKKLEPRKLVVEKKAEPKIILPPKNNPVAVKRPAKAEPDPNANVKPPRYHTVVRGEYLRLISRKYYGDEMKWRMIYDANKAKIKHPDLIYPGQKFLIPYLTTTKGATTGTPKTHTVKSGETLSSISRHYYGKTDWQKIFNANKGKISNPHLIYVGQVLTIP